LNNKKENTRTYTLTKTIKAPIQFAFDWCTDFREDDYKLTDSSSRRTMYNRSGTKVVYVDEETVDGEVRKSKSEVTLYPPDRWVLSAQGDVEDEEGEYRLEANDEVTTVLRMTFRVGHKLKPIPSKAKWEKDGNEFWDKLVVALEKEYRASKRVRK